MFAARTLGDANRWPEVWELNQGRPMDEAGTTWTKPWRTHAGWELELPATPPPLHTRDPARSHCTSSSRQPTTPRRPIRRWRCIGSCSATRCGTSSRVTTGMSTWIWCGSSPTSTGSPIRTNIPVGTDVVLPPFHPRRPRSRSQRRRIQSVAVHRIVFGDTLWDVVEGHYGLCRHGSGVVRRRLQRDHRSERASRSAPTSQLPP